MNTLGNIWVMEKIAFYKAHSYKQITVFFGIFQKDMFWIFSIFAWILNN
jgi:hypothetical protein